MRVHQNYIEQLIKECLIKDIQVIIYTPPAWFVYAEQLDEKQLGITRKYCLDVSKNYSNVHHFDFLKDKRFVKEDFRDAVHTNHRGAKKLTLILNFILRSY